MVVHTDGKQTIANYDGNSEKKVPSNKPNREGQVAQYNYRTNQYIWYTPSNHNGQKPVKKTITQYNPNKGKREQITINTYPEQNPSELEQKVEGVSK